MEDESNFDDFTKLQKRIARDVDRIRFDLSELQSGTIKRNSEQGIAKSALVRSELKMCSESLQQLIGVAQRKAARSTPEENEGRRKIIDNIRAHIDECTQLERTGGSTQAQTAYSRDVLFAGLTRPQVMTFDSIDLSGPVGPGSGGGKGGGGRGAGSGGGGGGAFHTSLPPIDAEIQTQIQEIRERDKQFEETIIRIGMVVKDLNMLALEAKDELAIQHQILTTLDEGIDSAHVKVNELNTNLTKTIEKVKKGDNFICIMVIMFLILGVLGYIYNMVKNGGA
eukprot:gnl/Spiro4/15605_TR8391_c0_g1_i2.p1 gnl/Spiro4/15605_TR8391_c0_g1~~gnl/Spiro4/15605_TR8391_c0_g1_i2.p1  ORF type:complete len:326 (+),score=90.35 gnl/Spiro4/15605_TR8391_c0_g1_i2:135-980(+)